MVPEHLLLALQLVLVMADEDTSAAIEAAKNVEKMVTQRIPAYAVAVTAFREALECEAVLLPHIREQRKKSDLERQMTLN